MTTKSKCKSPRARMAELVFMAFFVAVALAHGIVDNPLSAHVEINGVRNYGGQSLPKPSKILVYDFAISPKEVQVKKSQQIRLRHLIKGDKTAEKVGENAVEELSKQLVKCLRKPAFLWNGQGR